MHSYLYPLLKKDIDIITNLCICKLIFIFATDSQHSRGARNTSLGPEGTSRQKNAATSAMLIRYGQLRHGGILSIEIIRIQIQTKFSWIIISEI